MTSAFRRTGASLSAVPRIVLTAAIWLGIVPMLSAQEPAAAPPAALTPSPPAASTAATAARPSLGSVDALRARLERTRLARTPEMFGDFLFLPPTLVDTIEIFGPAEFYAIAGPAGLWSFPQKISESNHPLPRDRVFYNFNAYTDALNTRSTVGVSGPADVHQESQTLFRHTFGVEKTFLDEQCSIELRLPFAQFENYSHAFGGFAGASYSQEHSHLGNLLIALKMLLYQDEEFALAGGIGIEAPTAGNSTLTAVSSRLEIHNESVFVQPFLGAMWLPDPDWFCTAFLQVSSTANGNPVVYADPPAGFPRQTIGELRAPTVLFADVAVGRWLFQDRTEGILSGLAIVTELHETWGVSEIRPINSGPVAVWNGDRDLHVTNLSLGCQLQFGERSNLRLGTVVPLRNRQFDSEFALQWNVFY